MATDEPPPPLNSVRLGRPAPAEAATPASPGLRPATNGRRRPTAHARTEPQPASARLTCGPLGRSATTLRVPVVSAPLVCGASPLKGGPGALASAGVDTPTVAGVCAVCQRRRRASRLLRWAGEAENSSG
eukprot:scaffold10229_cov116-Isochrysis_galbana.AAC.6